MWYRPFRFHPSESPRQRIALERFSVELGQNLQKIFLNALVNQLPALFVPLTAF